MPNNFLYRIFNISQPDKTAIISKEKQYSYLDFKMNVLGLSKKLKKYSGKTVAIFLDDSPIYIFIFWSCVLTRVKTVLINKNNSLENLKYIIAESEANYLITDTKVTVDSCKILSLESLCNYKVSNDDSYLTPSKKEEVCFYLCTSGSTGKPKCVPHTLKDMEFCASTFNRTADNLKNTDIVYSVSKIPFAFGFGNSMYLPFFMHCAVFISNTSDLVQILHNIEEVKPTVLFGVPTIYTGLINLLDKRKIENNNLRLAISCGEVLPKIVGEQWEEKVHIPLLEGMGTTEFLYTFLINTPQKNKYGSTGQLIDGFEATIIDDNFNELKIGEIGNLYVKGNSLTKGYKNNRAASSFVNGGMLTGDLFLKDKDNYFWYIGRQNNVFKLNGKWVKAETIENELLKLPFVKETMVRAEFTNKNTTFLSAYMVIDENKITNITKRKLKNFLRKKLPHSNVPKFYFIVEKIPKGITGKLSRKTISDRKEII